MEDERQKKIDEAIKKKEARLSKTEQNILISWAINNATLLVANNKNEWSLEEKTQKIRELYPEFISMKREWELEQVEEEIIPIDDPEI